MLLRRPKPQPKMPSQPQLLTRKSPSMMHHLKKLLRTSRRILMEVRTLTSMEGTSTSIENITLNYKLY